MSHETWGYICDKCEKGLICLFYKELLKISKKKNTPIRKCANNMNSQFIKGDTEMKKIPSKKKKIQS